MSAFWICSWLVFFSSFGWAFSTPPQEGLFPSQVVSGSLTMIRILKDGPIHAEFEGIQIPFYKNASFFQAFLGIPYQRKPGKAVIPIQSGNGPFSLPVKILKAHYLKEFLHVNPKHVKPLKKDFIRIKKEQALIKKIYEKVTPEKLWEGPFILPLQTPITSAFGTQRIYNGVLKSFHSGIDFKAPVGTPILASASGRVVLARNLFYTGNTVVIDHGYGVMTAYAHLSKLRVKEEALVMMKQLLGYSGKTGRVNGPHLHWQTIVHAIKVNPLEFVKVIE